jgi:hypothetical protein
MDAFKVLGRDFPGAGQYAEAAQGAWPEISPLRIRIIPPASACRALSARIPLVRR